MFAQLSALLLPVAATCGWFMGRKDRPEINKPNQQQLRHDYFKGLNYLINEEPDKAVDVFVKLLEVDSDTVETHLALGNLFRRRGARLLKRRCVRPCRTSVS
jgi:lipopolysaccharide biosynthesis regulator YciM